MVKVKILMILEVTESPLSSHDSQDVELQLVVFILGEPFRILRE